MDERDRADAEHQQYLRDLRRHAFARPLTSADRQRAVEAQQLLADEEARVRAAALPGVEPARPETRLESRPETRQAPAVEPAVEPAAESEADAEEPPPRTSGRRTVLLLTAAALVVGVAVGFGAARATDDTAAGSAQDASSLSNDAQQTLEDQLLANMRATSAPYVGTGKASWIVGDGDSIAAETWFTRPQTASDLPEQPMSVGAEQGSLRLVYTSEEFGRVWVARGIDGDLCLYTLDATGFGALSCVSTAEFDKAGLGSQIYSSESTRVLTLRWDGWDFLSSSTAH